MALNGFFHNNSVRGKFWGGAMIRFPCHNGCWERESGGVWGETLKGLARNPKGLVRKSGVPRWGWDGLWVCALPSPPMSRTALGVFPAGLG